MHRFNHRWTVFDESKRSVGETKRLAAALFSIVLGYRLRRRLGNWPVHRDQPVTRILNVRGHRVPRNHLGNTRQPRGHDTSRAVARELLPGRPGAICTACAWPA